MIVVLADDISGAAELAGVALRHGLSAEVQTSFDPRAETDIVCLDTDSRSLESTAAAAIVTEATQQIAAARPVWVYKKCDSVLRGSVAAETRAMMPALGKTRALLVPANPSRGRVIRGGCYFVGDEPLHETIFSRDPEHPRFTSRVTDLLGGDTGAISVPDTQNAADVAKHAAAVDSDTLPVGGADFFAALLEQRVPGAPPQTEPASDGIARGAVLLVCGSAASWPDRRDVAQAENIPVFALPHNIAAISSAIGRDGQALIGIGDGPATAGRTAVELVSILADVVARAVREVEVERLLLEGGATAVAVARALGWSRFRACAGSAAGVGILVPVGAIHPRLFIKPGSYAWPPEIWPAL